MLFPGVLGYGSPSPIGVFWGRFPVRLRFHWAGPVRIEARGMGFCAPTCGRTESGRHRAVPEGQLYIRIRLSYTGIAISGDIRRDADVRGHGVACVVARPDGVRTPSGYPGGAIVHTDKAFLNGYCDLRFRLFGGREDLFRGA